MSGGERQDSRGRRRPENVRLLEAVLVPRGYDVVSPSTAAHALELAESAEPGHSFCSTW